MNKQGINGIDWCDYTWNVVSGCLGPEGNPCSYCYARKIANRFGNHFQENQDNIVILNEKYTTMDDKGKYRTMPYPYDFVPTFHKYRLDEPAKLKKPAKIFVCSMGDLFHDAIPDVWIEEVFKACEAAPWHTYMFLTKNPGRYTRTWLQDETDSIRGISYFGVSATNQSMVDNAMNNIGSMRDYINTFLSIEPMQEQITIPDIRWLKWVIIGQETGNRKGKIIPEDERVQDIIDQCSVAGVPVFVKKPLYNRFPIQQLPEGLKEMEGVT